MFPKHTAHGIAGQVLAQAAKTSSAPAPDLALFKCILVISVQFSSQYSGQILHTSSHRTQPRKKPHIWAFPFPLQVQIQNSEIMNSLNSELGLGLERPGPSLQSGSVAPDDNPPLIHTFPEGCLNPQERPAPNWEGTMLYSYGGGGTHETHPRALLRAGVGGFHITFPSTQRALWTSLQPQSLQVSRVQGEQSFKLPGQRDQRRGMPGVGNSWKAARFCKTIWTPQDLLLSHCMGRDPLLILHGFVLLDSGPSWWVFCLLIIRRWINV